MHNLPVTLSVRRGVTEIQCSKLLNICTVEHTSTEGSHFVPVYTGHMLPLGPSRDLDLDPECLIYLTLRLTPSQSTAKGRHATMYS